MQRFLKNQVKNFKSQIDLDQTSGKQLIKNFSFAQRILLNSKIIKEF